MREIAWPFGTLRSDAHTSQLRAIALLDLTPYTDNPDHAQEFRRYLALRLLRGYTKRLPMQSPEVDKVWHAFLQDAGKYKSFCDYVFGGVLVHVEGKFDPDPQFAEEYHRRFGEMPGPLWRTTEARGRVGTCDCA